MESSSVCDVMMGTFGFIDASSARSWSVMRRPEVVRATIVRLDTYCCCNGTYADARATPSTRLLDCTSRATPMTSSGCIGLVGPCGPYVGCDRYLPTASWPCQHCRAADALTTTTGCVPARSSGVKSG